MGVKDEVGGRNMVIVHLIVDEGERKRVKK
jgi:hypothetical protein